MKKEYSYIDDAIIFSRSNEQNAKNNFLRFLRFIRRDAKFLFCENYW